MKVSEPIAKVRSHQGTGEDLSRPPLLPGEVLNDLPWSEESPLGADMLLLHRCFSPLEAGLLISESEMITLYLEYLSCWTKGFTPNH